MKTRPIAAPSDRADVAPPATNRGVQNTSMSPAEGQNLLVDWLSFTDKSGLPIDALVPFLDPNEWVDMDAGLNGYQRARKQGHIWWLTGGKPDMGQHIIMSGQGCREIETAHHAPFTGWTDYARVLVALGTHATRCDIAIDDHDGLLKLATIKKALKSGDCTSRWKKHECLETRAIGGDALGCTIYVGSRSSDARLRFYDKTAEQAARCPKGDPESPSAAPNSHGTKPSTWIRAEIELHDKRAQAMVTLIAESEAEQFGAAIKGVLLGYIDFKKRGTDTNKSRWESARWWLRFLGNVEKLCLNVARATRTVLDVQKWIQDQVAPSLALVSEAFNGDRDWLLSMITIGRRKWKARHRAILATKPAFKIDLSRQQFLAA